MNDHKNEHKNKHNGHRHQAWTIWTWTSEFGVTPTSHLGNRLPEPISLLCPRITTVWPQLNTVAILYGEALYRTVVYAEKQYLGWSNITELDFL
jgi:hypothetical protein